MISEKQKGELSIYGQVLLSSLFPVIAVLTVSVVSPLYAAATGTGLSAMFFAVVLTVRRSWLFPKSRTVWRDVLLVTFFNGIVFYSLIFIGFKYTSAGNGAVVGLMEVFFTFIIVNLLVKHERFIWVHALGAFLMALGALFILMPKWNGTVNIGDLLIILATISAPIGNMFAQRARKQLSAEILMFVRSVIATLFLFVLAAMFEPIPKLTVLASSWPALFFSGFLYLGLSKILWVEAIHRLSIAKTVSLSAINIPLTLLFAWILLSQSPTLEQLAATVPMIGGMFLLLRE